MSYRRPPVTTPRSGRRRAPVMKNISAWAIRHPVSPVVLFVVLLFMGIVAFVRLPITLNPDIAFPLVHVNVSQPGAAPQEIENTGHAEDRGIGCGCGQHPQHHLARARRRGQHLDRIPDRHAH